MFKRTHVATVISFVGSNTFFWSPWAPGTHMLHIETYIAANHIVK